MQVAAKRHVRIRKGLTFFHSLGLLGLATLYLLVLNAHVAVSAQGQTCIPVLGQKWTKNYIGVYVAAGVSDIQRRQVLLALNVWYSAQQWFIDSFEAGVGSPYLFYLTDSPHDAAITVSFLIGQGLSFAGRTVNFTYTVPGNAFIMGEVQINLPPSRASNPDDLEVESVILHEFGHVLGLGHSDIQSDAMYAIDNYPQNYGLPSTLDLYAVYLLKQTPDPSSLGGSICLPSEIGYGVPPWVRQNGSTISIVYPGGKFVSIYAYTFTASPIAVGKIGVGQLFLKNAGQYPVRVVTLTAQTNSSQILIPDDPLPQELDPGISENFTFLLQGADTKFEGTHTIVFHVGFQTLATGGWLLQTDNRTLPGTYEVTAQTAQSVSESETAVSLVAKGLLSQGYFIAAMVACAGAVLFIYSLIKRRQQWRGL